jgi:cobalt-zinc-cadmium efflux system outer membrane protein
MSKGRGGATSGPIKGAKAAESVILLPAMSVFLWFSFLIFAVVPSFAAEGTVKLQDLIREAVKNNPEIHMSAARTRAAEHRIPQAASLADPMVMMGYENEGTDSPYTFNRETKGMPADSRWMFSVSQALPYPGKLALKGDMAARDAESQKDLIDFTRLNTVVRVKELYYDLSLAYTNIDLLKAKASLFARTEDAAIARYAAGVAPQQEVLMAQTEKYMLLEREQMFKQKIQSLEAMLNAALGREVNAPLGGRPEKLSYAPFGYGLDELIKMSSEKYPLIKSREKMVGAAQAKVAMARKEFYPDFTLGANYFARSSQFPDMWSLTTTVNVPLYYKKKQEPAVLEAEASLLGAKKEVEAAKLMAASVLRDNYSMVKTADSLMALYKDGLIPKSYQDFELALAGYVTGKVEAITVISRLKPLIDNEMLYWGQFVERAKAIARIDGIAVID